MRIPRDDVVAEVTRMIDHKRALLPMPGRGVPAEKPPLGYHFTRTLSPDACDDCRNGVDVGHGGTLRMIVALVSDVRY